MYRVMAPSMRPFQVGNAKCRDPEGVGSHQSGGPLLYGDWGQ